MPEDHADHYFSPQPSTASRPSRARLEIAGHPTMVLATDRGVFASGSVDLGTRVLIESGARPAPGARTLVDLGAGYGPITIALALWAPEATVWAVEVNERARDLTVANAATAGVADRVKVVSPDDVPADLVADGIWSNPPIRIGKAALHDLLTQWLGRLTPEGAAHLVVGKNLGADSLARWLAEEGHDVVRRSSRKGYRLLDVTPAPRS